MVEQTGSSLGSLTQRSGVQIPATPPIKFSLLNERVEAIAVDCDRFLLFGSWWSDILAENQIEIPRDS